MLLELINRVCSVQLDFIKNFSNSGNVLWAKFRQAQENYKGWAGGSTWAALVFNELPIWQSVFWCQCSWLGPGILMSYLSFRSLLYFLCLFCWFSFCFVFCLGNTEYLC